MKTIKMKKLAMQKGNTQTIIAEFPEEIEIEYDNNMEKVEILNLVIAAITEKWKQEREKNDAHSK